MKQKKVTPQNNKKKSKQEIIKNLKKSLAGIKKEWDKAMKELEKFDPMEGMKMPDFEQQMKDFNLGGDVNI